MKYQFVTVIAGERDESLFPKGVNCVSAKPCFVNGQYFPTLAAASKAVKNPKAQPDYRRVSKEEYKMQQEQGKS